MWFLLGCALIAFLILSNHFLGRWREQLFVDYMDMVDDNMKMMPAEAWILNGEYRLEKVNREGSMKLFRDTHVWDHNFASMIVFQRKPD